MAPAAILDFQKFKILTVVPLSGANMRHLAKFHQNRPNGRRYMAILRFFSKWPPSAILDLLGAYTGTTHDDHLVVSIVMPNLIKIDSLVSIT